MFAREDCRDLREGEEEKAPKESWDRRVLVGSKESWDRRDEVENKELWDHPAYKEKRELKETSGHRVPCIKGAPGESISAPKVTVFPASQLIVNDSNTVALFCSSTGNPAPQLSWVRVDESLPSNRIKMTSDGLMQISDVCLEDAGKYKCMAHNILGKDENAAILVVQSKLRV